MKLPVEELKKCYLFKEMTEAELAQLGALGKPEVVHERTTIFEEGEIPRALYLIHYGSVKTETWSEGTDQQVAMLGNGAVFGEMSFEAHQPRITHAIAMERTEIYAFMYSDLENLFAHHPETALKFFRALAFRMGRRVHSLIKENIRLHEEMRAHRHAHHHL